MTGTATLGTGHRLWFIILFLTGLLPTPGWTATPSSPSDNSSFWSIQLENDVWGSGDDRYYTHGTELSTLSLNNTPDWLTRLGEGLPFVHLGSRSAVQYSVGQKIFTPRDTQQQSLIRSDRPYAGWLYGGVSLLSDYIDEPDRKVSNILGINLGVIGPSSQADQVQKEIHELFSGIEPRGWDNQLQDEIGLLLTYTRRWQYFHKLGNGLTFETAPHLVATLGNVYTYAGGGLMLRLGKGLRNDIAAPNISPGFTGTPYLRTSRGINWYLFGGIEGRAVARNIFLDGNTFEDSHAVDKEPLVGDLQLGFALQYANLRFAFSNVWRTREFSGQDGNTRFGTLNLSFSVPF